MERDSRHSTRSASSLRGAMVRTRPTTLAGNALTGRIQVHMHQVLFGVGIVAIFASMFVALYGLFTSQSAIMIQALSLLVSGSVLVTLRNIVVKLDGLLEKMEFNEMIARRIQMKLEERPRDEKSS